jgi:hypothetical protein
MKDPSIVSNVVVLHGFGWNSTPTRYNLSDNAAAMMVMKNFKYITWDGDINGNFNGHEPIPANISFTSRLPNNPFAQSIKTYWANPDNGYWAVYKNIGDAPPAFYLFQHSLWKNVVRKLQNGTTTTSDNYDYLTVSSNDWSGYWPLFEGYVTNPVNYIPGTVEPPTEIHPPVVEITNTTLDYALNTPFDITVDVASPDGVAITKVEFYHGTKKFAEDVTTPFAKTLTISNPGIYVMSVKAIDARGLSTQSESKNFNLQPDVVIPNEAPNVTITTTGVYPEGAITLIADAVDPDGSITKVEFFIDGIKVGETTSAPYETTWVSTAGTYTLSATATDNEGTVGYSTPVTILVEEEPPYVPGPSGTLEGIFTYKQFGAKGDGVTDDTDAIQRCFEAAAAVNGAVIAETPKYAYVLTDTITVKPKSGQQTWVEFQGVGSNVLQHIYKGPDERPVFYVLGLKSAEWSGLNVALQGQTGVTIIESTTKFEQPSSSDIIFKDFRFTLGEGADCVGIRTGRGEDPAPNGADESIFTYINVRVDGTKKPGQVAFVNQGRNTLANNWYGGFIHGCESVYSNNYQGVRGNGAVYFYGVHTSQNLCNYVFDFEGTYGIYGGRYELDGMMLRTGTGSHHAAITLSGCQISRLQDPVAIELNTGASLTIDNCRIFRRPGILQDLVKVNTTALTSVMIRSGAALANNLVTGGADYLSIQGLGKLADETGVKLAGFYADI